MGCKRTKSANNKESMFPLSKEYRFAILAINTGSTSTKIAVYHDEEVILELTLSHSADDIARFATTEEHLMWRRDLILESLKEHDIQLATLSIVIGRGGLLRPVESGIYEVSESMCDELRHCTPQHASNFSAIISLDIAQSLGIKAYIADPIVVDERDGAGVVRAGEVGSAHAVGIVAVEAPAVDQRRPRGPCAVRQRHKR